MLHRSSFQACVGDVYRGVDWEQVRVDADHGRSLSDRTSVERGLNDFETHYPHLPFLLAHSNHLPFHMCTPPPPPIIDRCCPVHTSDSSRYNRITVHLTDTSSHYQPPSVYRLLADIQTSVHDHYFLHPHFIILLSHTVVYLASSRLQGRLCKPVY